MENKNVVALIGQLESLEEIHEINNMRFEGHKAVMSVERLSGVQDSMILLIPADIAVPASVSAGMPIMATGAMQTQKSRQTGKVLVYVLTDYIGGMDSEHWEPENDVCMSGTIGKGTHYRETPKGRFITDLFLRVPCLIHDTDCFIPCICWGSLAKKAAEWHEGDALTLEGRLQSRNYTKVLEDGETEIRTCYEVSINRVTK